jgi:two-component system LytT family response regulator
MKKLKCVIVDDEPRNVELLSYYINKYCPELEIEGEFSRRKLAESYLKDNSVDVLFLDIVLDEGSGFDLLDNIDYSDIHVVMCTAHGEFALKAIQYEVVDYLLKPVEIQDLKDTILKIKDRVSKHEQSIFEAKAIGRFANNNYTLNQSIPVRHKKEIEFVPVKDIVFIESIYEESAKSALMMRDESIRHSSQALNKIERILDPDVFYKLNRSFIINIREITRIEKRGNYVCVMSNGFKLGIPRGRYKKLLFEIERIFGMSI